MFFLEPNAKLPELERLCPLTGDAQSHQCKFPGTDQTLPLVGPERQHSEWLWWQLKLPVSRGRWGSTWCSRPRCNCSPKCNDDQNGAHSGHTPLQRKEGSTAGFVLDERITADTRTKSFTDWLTAWEQDSCCYQAFKAAASEAGRCSGVRILARQAWHGFRSLAWTDATKVCSLPVISAGRKPQDSWASWLPRLLEWMSSGEEQWKKTPTPTSSLHMSIYTSIHTCALEHVHTYTHRDLKKNCSV